MRTLSAIVLALCLSLPPAVWLGDGMPRSDELTALAGYASAFDGDDDDDDDDDGFIGDDDDDSGGAGDDDDDDDEIDPALDGGDLAPEGAPESFDELDADFLDDDFAADGAFEADDDDDFADEIEDEATSGTPEGDSAAAEPVADVEAAGNATDDTAGTADGEDAGGAATSSEITEVTDPGGMTTAEFGSDSDFDFEPDEVVGVNLSGETRARVRALGFTVLETHKLPAQALELTRLEIPEDEDFASALALLRTQVPRGYFGRNHRYALAMDDACSGIRCYGLGLIGWPERSDDACGAEVAIGIVDTAIDLAHPALPRERIVIQRLGDDGPRATEHGTAVATLLVGQTAGGVAGLLPQARLYAADAFTVDADGKAHATSVDLVRALDWLLAQRVDVINLSLTGPHSNLLAIAVRRVIDAGIAVFAAAGNNGPAAPAPFPASDPDVIAVTAIDRFLAPYVAANRGGFIDLAAPGVKIWTGTTDGGRFVDGTSFASVYAAAAGALIHRVREGRHPRETLARLIERVRDLGPPGHDEVFGHGLVQTPAACAP